MPRPKVHWPQVAAVIAYDAQIAASGITTVFDSLRIGTDLDYSSVQEELDGIIGAIDTARSQNLLRADHRMHLRCEICTDDVVQQTSHLIDRHVVGLFSLMEHTPGMRQFVDPEAWKTYYGGKSGRTEAELNRLMDQKRARFAANYATNRAKLVDLASIHSVVMASHDDA